MTTTPCTVCNHPIPDPPINPTDPIWQLPDYALEEKGWVAVRFAANPNPHTPTWLPESAKTECASCGAQYETIVDTLGAFGWEAPGDAIWWDAS